MNLFFYNTDAGSGQELDQCRKLIRHKIAATSGPKRTFGEQLRQLAPQDILLMYANGYGVVAIGSVQRIWDGKTHTRLLYYSGTGFEREYRVPVDWHLDWIDNPISLAELQQATGNSFVPRGAVRKVVKHRCAIERLLEQHSAGSIPQPEAADLKSDLPSRIETRVNRIIRDTALARDIKMRHGYRCQICGSRIALLDGGYYAEAHHLVPLGKDHGGRDTHSNIICVCPNHHAMLDYGVIRLSLKMIRYFGNGHAVDRVSVDYHNSVIFRG